MKTLRAHAKKILAVTAVVVALGAGGAVAGGHLSNAKADKFNATHAVAGATTAAKTAPAPAAVKQPAGGSGQGEMQTGDGGRGD